VKKTDIALLNRRVERLEFQAPPMPSNIDILAAIVRLPELWTPQEYAYIQHFHRCYGNDPRTWRGDLVYDRWLYWHLLAMERYHMSNRERMQAFVSLPRTCPHAWHFESNDYAGKPFRICGIVDNEVPYDVQSMQRRGWQFVTVYLPVGILFKLDAPFPHPLFALVEDKPDITMLFDGPGAFEKLMYYVEHREKIHKKHKVRRIEAALDFQVYEPDAGYSYRWEDGKLIEGSYMWRLFQQRQSRHIEQVEVE
jgi:hypothetical protein